MKQWPCLALLLLSACAPKPEAPASSDFAVLAQAEEGFQQARAGVELEFPRDHGAHPGFRIEWWYLTANLRGTDGGEYGAQWTLFRTAPRPGARQDSSNPWHDPQIYMAHLAITTPDGHVSAQRYARGGEHGGLAQAGVSAEPFMAWLDDWSLQSQGPAWLPLELRASQDAHGVELQLSAEQPLVLQGDQGFSQKHPDGGGSHYYSQPFLQASGRLILDDEVVPVTGQAWLDREWSSQFLQTDQVGWDWFALHLDSGEKLMLFRLRSAEAKDPHYLYGTLIAPDGTKQDLDPAGIGLEIVQTVRVAERQLPLHWRLALPEIGRTLELKALHPAQWMAVDFAYWEGVVLVSGDGPESSGRGYLELTGYPSVD